MLAANSKRIVQLIGRSSVPAIYPVVTFAEAGGLMFYGPDLYKAFDRAAAYVDRILKGARPAELPIEQMDDLELLVNLRTAKAQGITIPSSILQRAQRVIE